MPPDIVLLLCDTARADAFSPFGGRSHTPAMEQLAREGAAFTSAQSHAPWTLPSTATILSGRLPTEHGITADTFRWRDGKPTSPAQAVRAYDGPWLPDELKARGYRTWGASCNTWISEWGGFDRSFETFLDLRDRTRLPRGASGTMLRRARRLWGKVDRGGQQALEAFRGALAADDRRPLFAMVNLMECHAPYDPPRPYYPYSSVKRVSTRRLSGGTNKARRYLSYNTRLDVPPVEYVRTIRDLYFAAARYEDALLGRFVQAIRERGRPTVLAAVADHGEHLGEMGLFNHNSALTQILLHVPLVGWGQGVDIGSAGGDEPVGTQGLASWLRSLADGGRPTPLEPAEEIVSEYESTLVHTDLALDIRARIESGDPTRVPPMVFHPGMAARRGRWKYVAVQDGPDSLFDLSVDPEESNDVGGANPAVVTEMRSLKDGWLKRREVTPSYEAGVQAEGDIEEHLRMLGYIE